MEFYGSLAKEDESKLKSLQADYDYAVNFISK
jgi:hypothetical protein